MTIHIKKLPRETFKKIEVDYYSNVKDSSRNQQISSNPYQNKDVEPVQLQPVNAGLLILGGFITALGIVAVALAFTVLSVSTVGMNFVVIAGFTGLIGGLGLLSTGIFKHRQHVTDESYDHLSDFEGNQYDYTDSEEYPYSN